MIADAKLEALLAQAAQARLHAYCPHSSFAVGAAVLTNSGAVHHGCNVENASYGLSLCAERNAVTAAVASGMQPGMLLALALITATPQPVVPCGACLQVLAEFAAEDCRIICATLEGQVLRQPLTELLPRAFSM